MTMTRITLNYISRLTSEKPLVTVSKYKISFEHLAVKVCFYLLNLKTVCFVLLSSSSLSKPICAI